MRGTWSHQKSALADIELEPSCSEMYLRHPPAVHTTRLQIVVEHKGYKVVKPTDNHHNALLFAMVHTVVLHNRESSRTWFVELELTQCYSLNKIVQIR